MSKGVLIKGIIVSYVGRFEVYGYVKYSEVGLVGV